MTTMRKATLTAMLVAVALPAGRLWAQQDAATVVYLVRHAEKVEPPPAESPRDPPLNDAGRERAAELARVLGNAGVTRILSTDYRRTRETAAALAEALGLQVEIYDALGLPELADRLRSGPGRVVVVGHSNTTPLLVELLGGDPGPPIDEAMEYDRLYVMVFEQGRPPTTIRLRYGASP